MADERRWTDKSLGMHCLISRRDFLNGVAIAIGSIGTGLNSAWPPAAQADESWPQDQPGYYPPRLNGLRGSHPGSFENAHALRSASFQYCAIIRGIGE
jgi:spermidine dehydrogenase